MTAQMTNDIAAERAELIVALRELLSEARCSAAGLAQEFGESEEERPLTNARNLLIRLGEFGEDADCPND